MLAARRAKSSLKGERRSRARGLSVEFADHRNYVLGDDLRYLDWNLFGRLDRLFLKLYEEERELPVRIFLDASESMNFGTPTKFDFARQVAAAIGYVALCGFDRVAVAPFPDRAATVGDPELAHRNALRSVRGKKSAMPFFRDLSALSASGAADLNASLKRGAMEARQSGVAIVQILAPEELDPTTFGDLRLIDSENGDETEVTFGKYRLKAYQQSVANYVQRLREHCAGRGIRFFSVSSAADLGDLLLKQLRASEVWA